MMTTAILLAGFFCWQGTLLAQTDQKYFLDVHKMEPGSVTFSGVAEAHTKDLNVQDAHGVSFVNYWVDEQAGYIYCLSRANVDSDVYETHKEAHGLVPAAIYEVVAGDQSNYTGNGYLFIDVHDLGPGNVTAEAVAEAHIKDLETQEGYHVNFINYWVDVKQGKVFCLAEAPSKDAVIQTHTAAHGLVPEQVLMVKQGE